MGSSSGFLSDECGWALSGGQGQPDTPGMSQSQEKAAGSRAEQSRWPQGERELQESVGKGQAHAKPDRLPFMQNYNWKYKKPQCLKTPIYIFCAPKHNKQRIDL